MIVTKKYEDGQTEQVLLSAAVAELMSPLLRRLQMAIHNHEAIEAHHYAQTLAVLDRVYEDSKYSESQTDS